ncbi:MAG: hypothetical protein RMZ41_025175 [Nostoc sp. DedVER02]|uniref:hypothetical protein n=1 Tax=unclassified Nostoc TaxID=2593658 RepID=UPI002AD3AD82|nr:MULTISPECIES: hypothetical protein [unclassified Nostoc]MDZ7986099.1 hypothetical protein [Nostoc sp. DedVER02]MDZ8115406.1 hypothetical protein [Nostoc sp. DedVER01b]
MKLYFKHQAESDLGMGIAYLEFDGDSASRQVEIYGDKWFLSNRVYHTQTGGIALCDQPLSETGLGREHEISQSEFELVWSEALKKTM